MVNVWTIKDGELLIWRDGECVARFKASLFPALIADLANTIRDS